MPGIGPHKERNTVKLVVDEIRSRPGCVYSNDMALEVKYPSSPRSKCDICIGREPDWDWAIEVKMLRFLGNNGKPNDNILMHILSPYPSHRSALTDCQKLVESGFSGRKAIVIYGYDYDEWPMDPAIDAFELLATKQNSLSERCEGRSKG